MAIKVVAVVILATVSAFCGRGDVDLSKATKLQVEVVDYDPANPPTPPNHGLFEGGVGSSMKLSSFGVVDPVGTSLNLDFDGDGLPNLTECFPDLAKLYVKFLGG